MKFFLTLCLFMLGSLVAIFTLTPAKYTIPQIIQSMIDIKDPNHNRETSLEEIEAMQKNYQRCYQNTDCVLQKCGKAPNCNSFVVNKHYFKNNRTDNGLACTEMACPNQLDTYAICEDNQCVITHLFPSPTPTDQE